MPEPIHRTVATALRAAGLGPAGTIVAGLSGGVDSLVLTAALAELWRAGLGPRVVALHVNHQLRPEAGREVDRVIALAGQLGVPVEVATVDVAAWGRVLRQGTESAARAARYAALAEAARAHATRWVAVAHNLNDQAETVLLRLARGGRLEGLGGMRPIARRPIPLRPETDETLDLCILRPLLGTPRPVIEADAAARGLVPVEDPSNRSPQFRRNIVRHQVLPLLERVAPGALESVARTAAWLRDDADALSALAAEAASTVLGQLAGLVTVDRAGLRALAPALQRRLLLDALARTGPAGDGFSLERVEALRESLLCGQVGTRLQLGAGISAYIDYARAAIGPDHALAPALRAATGFPTIDPGTTIAIDGTVRLPLGGRWSLTASTTGPGWELRTRRPGDVVRMPGGRRTRLQDLLVDRKVPGYLRDWLPLLARGRGVYWVAGVFDAELRLADDGLLVELREQE